MRFGTEFSARSIGTVICCSTSSAACPGEVVITTTCVSEMSGYASTLSCRKQYTPTAITAIVKEIVRNRCWRAKRRSRPIIPQALLSICPQLRYAIDNDLIPRLEFSLDRRSSTVLPENSYGKFFKLSGAKLTKHG